MDKIKEKPQAVSGVREKAKAAPKELVHRGLENSADRLRTGLRDTAQRGQQDEYGGDRIEDTAADSMRHMGRGAEKLIKARQKNHASRGSASLGNPTAEDLYAETYSGRGSKVENMPVHSPAEAAVDAGRRVKTKDIYIRTQAETPATGLTPSRTQGQQQFIRERGRQAAQENAKSRAARSWQPKTGPSRSGRPSDDPQPAGRPLQGKWTGKSVRGPASKNPGTHAAQSISVRTKEIWSVKEAKQGRTVRYGKLSARLPGQTVQAAANQTAGRAAAQSGHAAAVHALQRARATRAAQQAVRAQRAAKRAGSAAKKAAARAGSALRAIYAAARGMAAAAAAGSSVVLALLILVCLFGLLVASPFGILFTTEPTSEGTVALSTAIAQINQEYTEKLDALQSGDYDQIIVNGSPPDWKEVVAVFAVKTAGTDDGVDVVTLDEDRVERMRTVFWDMVSLDSKVETTGQEGEEPKTVLTITITTKTLDEMREYYSFTDQQNNMLDELLDNLELIGGAIGNLDVTDSDAQALLASLPNNLSAERRAVIEAACTLVGKVNYFWGGKSLSIGWNPLWGTTMRVTAAGSSTTGTYRPYGLDCSGFVDWVFYNATGGTYVIGHGGGTYSQHAYCTPIAWSEAQPGDLVFYPGDSHVGIVGGRDAGGNLLIIHCASGYNNVVITGLEGFTSIGRPVYFTK